MKIEVWSDFACPFCYIGKRKLENALEKFPHRNQVTLEFKSYELGKDADVDPTETYYDIVANKYGQTLEEVKQSSAGIAKQAAKVGLDFQFDHMKPTNTFDAHRLAKYAATVNKGHDMTERLLHAYFTESKHIGDHDTLIKLALDVGLDKEAVTQLLVTNRFTRDVREDQAQASQLDVQGVPFFVFAEKYGLSGAQPTSAFIEVLDKVWEEVSEQPVLQSLNQTQSKTTYCTDEGCEEE